MLSLKGSRLLQGGDDAQQVRVGTKRAGQGCAEGRPLGRPKCACGGRRLACVGGARWPSTSWRGRKACRKPCLLSCDSSHVLSSANHQSHRLLACDQNRCTATAGLTSIG